MLRLAGCGLLVAAWRLSMLLADIGLNHAEHEPAMAYLLALLTFWAASAGFTLVALGRRLLGHVVVAERWLPHVPAMLGQAPSGRSML